MEIYGVAATVINNERFTLMLLLYSKGATNRINEPVEGITRVQKLMFLLSKERAVAQVGKLKFEPYAYGPYDQTIYDNLAFLRNMRLLDDGSAEDQSGENATTDDLMSVVNAQTTVPVRDATEFDEDVSFDFLMEGLADELPDRYQTERYKLSALGIAEVEHRLKAAQNDPNLPKVLGAIENVKTRFNQMRLREILKYVYDKYPDSAKNSVIADAVRIN